MKRLVSLLCCIVFVSSCTLSRGDVRLYDAVDSINMARLADNMNSGHLQWPIELFGYCYCMNLYQKSDPLTRDKEWFATVGKSEIIDGKIVSNVMKIEISFDNLDLDVVGTQYVIGKYYSVENLNFKMTCTEPGKWLVEYGDDRIMAVKSEEEGILFRSMGTSIQKEPDKYVGIIEYDLYVEKDYIMIEPLGKTTTTFYYDEKKIGEVSLKYYRKEIRTDEWWTYYSIEY